jgi:hypothetical protein
MYTDSTQVSSFLISDEFEFSSWICLHTRLINVLHRYMCQRYVGPTRGCLCLMLLLVYLKLLGQVPLNLSSVAGTEQSTFNYLEHRVTVVGEY